MSTYETFFPFGDSTPFASLLFRLYDVSGAGSITFSDFLVGMSVTTRGGIEEKVDWAFRLYDRDGDGRVSRNDMLQVVESVYRMMGSLVPLAEDEDTPSKRVEKIFRLMGQVPFHLMNE